MFSSYLWRGVFFIPDASDPTARFVNSRAREILFVKKYFFVVKEKTHVSGCSSARLASGEAVRQVILF